MGSDYPSETFRVLKTGELREFGEYRTQRLVLAAWDAMDGKNRLWPKFHLPVGEPGRGMGRFVRNSKQHPRGNAHRLLLLYAIECGLKALWILNENRTLYNGKDVYGNPIGGANGHDLSEPSSNCALAWFFRPALSR
ncbi:MAG: hypothetical protein IPJ18_20515 [Betaproteobacteria bacterium]|nr:hypothetical protein [Betaproteobacteria bacterium]